MSDATQAFADSTTRLDLELESRGDAAGTVFGLFARPHTARGAAALRRRIAAPFTNLEDIREAQVAVSDGVRTVMPFESFVGCVQPERIERYLHSQMEIPSAGHGMGGFLSGAWTAARHGECLVIAREGRECLARFISGCRDWTRLSGHLHHSTIVRTLTARLASIASTLDAAVAPCGTGPAQLLALDRFLRGDHHATIREALEVLGELDALHALGATFMARAWTFPGVHEGPPLVRIRGLRHPLVASPVENDVDLGGEHRTILLTGPNMAGKTTYMKSVGIAVYLAHLGVGVPAREMELTPFDRLITVIGIHDSVASGSSAFHYEVTRLDRGLDALLAGRRCLLLFDELMRGTNAADALEACRLVLSTLLRSENCCAALATHLPGLVDAFAAEPGLTLGHFEAEMKDDVLAYDFHLRPGGYQGRMAMALLDQMGITAKLASLRDGVAAAPTASST